MSLMFNGHKINQIYIGKPNECCCGCSGTHYRPTDPEWQKKVETILRLKKMGRVFEQPETEINPETGAIHEYKYFAYECKSKLYIVYFEEE